MSYDPQPGQDPTFSAETSTTVGSPPDLDLRDGEGPAEPREDAQSSTVVAAEPQPDFEEPEEPEALSDVTLASLAFRLFTAVENQIARDPHAITLTSIHSRLDVLERGVTSALSRTEALAGVRERMDRLESRPFVTDAGGADVTDVLGRVAALERRVELLDPGSEMLTTVIERMDEIETQISADALRAVNIRVDTLESRVPSPEMVKWLTERIVAIEQRLTGPEVISRFGSRLDEMDRKLATNTQPETKGSGRWITASALILAAAVIALIVLIAVI
jgi:tetrahydromethanopterin S-methyltransferase subunit G